ncbi:MAG: hypothetical protein LBR40_03980 [Bacilli bacterium]|nr:hypothetical protein [Bacilli bacterium]
MNKKTDNLYYIIIIILVILFTGYRFFINNKDTSLLIYQPTYYDDCHKNVIKVNEYFDYTNIIKSNEVKASNDTNNDDYQKSSCIVLTNYVMDKPFLTLDKYDINHLQGNNDLTYQISYQTILDNLKTKKSLTDLDKKIISSLEYYLSNDKFLLLYPASSGIFQLNEPLIGPNEDATSGTYHLNIYLELVHNYDTRNNKVYYTFRGLLMKYEKE